ncbi:MAG: hypothetical protein Q9169_001298 [Polycauliona sp. 2 TL-2023]
MSSQTLLPSPSPPQVIVPSSLRIGQYFTVILGFGLSTLAISARLYTKLRITRKLLSEDYFSFTGYLSTVETIIYDPIIVMVKISILLQYVTLFVVHRRSVFHYTIHVTIWIIVLFYIAATFVYAFNALTLDQCSPRRKLWVPSTPGRCLQENTRGVLSGSINVASDLVILILPLPILARLQMPLAKKLRLAFVFSFGLFACISSIIRLVYSIQLDPDQSSTEYQLSVNRQGLWAFAEISIGIIVGCMPLVHKSSKHLWTKLPTTSSFRKFTTSSGSSSWRRLLGKSSASGGSTGKNGSQDSASTAPQIDTLNMTRASFAGTGDYFYDTTHQSEKALPTVPPPVLVRKPLPERSDLVADVQDGYLPKKVDDTEKALDEAVNVIQSWQGRHSKAETRESQTKRARYDLYPHDG